MKLNSLAYIAVLSTCAFAGSPDGNWNSFGISTPQYLSFGDQYTMSGGYDFEVFGPESLVVSGGTFDGGASSMEFLEGGAVRVAPSGEPVEYLWRNANEDVIIGARKSYVGGGNRTHTFSVVLREPTSLFESDLLGDWQAVRIQIPDRMTYEYNEDFELSELAGHHNFDLESFQISFTSPGVDQYIVSHQSEGVLGSFSAASNDTISTSFGLSLKINASKNVMVATESESSANPNDANRVLLIFIKKATTAATLESMSGKWPLGSLDYPRQVDAYQGEEFNPIGHNEFEVSRENNTLSPFGVIDTTRISLGSAGRFTATTAGDPTSYGYYTEDQQVALTWQKSTSPNNGRFGFSMLVRYERPFVLAFDPDDPTQLAVTVPFDDSGLKLMRSTDMKDWQEVTVSGDGAHIEAMSDGAFYRLEEENE